MSGFNLLSRPRMFSADVLLPGWPPEIPSGSPYNKLPTTHSFRLLQIIGVHRYIKCTMSTVSLQQHPPYRALSYCWGSSEQSVTLCCNGTGLKISPNLAEGLKGLHLHARASRKEGTQLYWIDQVCINQEDLVERAQQVRMMRAIYQHSINTIIWLPLKNGIAKDAKSIISDIRDYQQQDMGIHRRSREVYSARIVLRSDIRPELPPVTDKRWIALTKLLESPWFERCWVLQEIAVSKGDPIVLCGNQQIVWSNLQKVVTWLNNSGSEHRTERMELVNSIQQVVGRQHWGDREVPYTVSHLHVLLRLTNPFRSTDPRDKIFALLGLSSATQNPGDWPDELAPEYTRSVQDVYAAASKHCIQQTNSLNILSQSADKDRGRNGSQDLDFPSWVPRWDLMDSTRRVSSFSLTQDPDGSRNLCEAFNKASKGTQVMMDPDTPLGILRVYGMQVDAVKLRLPTVKTEDADFHAGLPERYGDYLSKLIPQLYRRCKGQVTHTSYSFDRTFFLVTTAGLTPEHGDARCEPPSSYEAIEDLAQGWAKAQTDSDDARLVNPNPSLTDMDYRPQIYSLAPYDIVPPVSLWDRYPNRYIPSLQRLMNRCLFITSSGHLGLGPASMRSGDTVAILFGGNVPYVLRRLSNKQWHFVGECYLDGYMDGEALDNEGKDASSHEWFELV